MEEEDVLKLLGMEDDFPDDPDIDPEIEEKLLEDDPKPTVMKPENSTENNLHDNELYSPKVNSTFPKRKNNNQNNKGDSRPNFNVCFSIW